MVAKKNGKSLCIACHLYARTMLIFSVLLKLTDVLSRTIVRQKCERTKYIEKILQHPYTRYTKHLYTITW